MASLETRLANLATRIATECKALRTMLNGNLSDLSTLSTSAKTSLVAAINELQAEIVAIGTPASINDAAASGTTTYSSNKINDLITAALDALTTGAPTAMNTLDELAAALGDDANFAATITAALGNRVRADAAQSFTAPQKLQARQNIDAYGSVEIGNPDADIVTTFNAGLV